MPLPFARYPTNRGWHYYYYFPDSHRNQSGNFDAFNCQGQWIKSHYLLLHDGGLALYKAIESGKNVKEHPLPIDIYRKSKAVKSPKKKGNSKKTQNNKLKNIRLDLENMSEGDGRYKAIFFNVGQFAKEVIRPETLAQFEAIIWPFAVGENLRCKEPLDDEELNKIVKAKSEYHFPLSKIGWTQEQQRNGGLKNGKLRRAHNTLRDEAIFNDYMKGFSADTIAHIYSLKRMQIYRIIAKNKHKNTAEDHFLKPVREITA